MLIAEHSKREPSSIGLSHLLELRVGRDRKNLLAHGEDQQENKEFSHRHKFIVNCRHIAVLNRLSHKLHRLFASVGHDGCGHIHTMIQVGDGERIGLHMTNQLSVGVIEVH